jgi:PTS system mannose-specific IIA component
LACQEHCNEDGRVAAVAQAPAIPNGNDFMQMSAQETERELAFIIITHGDIGESLLAVAEYILGRKLANFVAVKVPFMGELHHVMGSNCPSPFAERRRLIREQIRQAKKQVDRGGGIIVLADLLGGTGFTVASECLTADQGVIIAGVNLPMLLKAAEVKQGSPVAVAVDLVERSRKAVVYRAAPSLPE